MSKAGPLSSEMASDNLVGGQFPISPLYGQVRGEASCGEAFVNTSRLIRMWPICDAVYHA